MLFKSLLFLSVVCYYVKMTGCLDKEILKIGGLFTDTTQELTFKIATHRVNNEYPHSDFKLIPITHKVSHDDILETYKATCKLFQMGIIGLFGPSSTFTSRYVQSLCDVKEIPHIETHGNYHTKRNETMVNLHPCPEVLSNLFSDLIRNYGWRTIVILYDNDLNLLSIKSLLELNQQKGMKIILRQLELTDGTYRSNLTNIKSLGKTNFVLACSIGILEEILRQLQQVGMMTDTYSYIIANLDTQTIDLTPFQYAGTNITTIRMLDPEMSEVLQIADNIKKLSSGPVTNIPTLFQAWSTKLETALIFDAVKLFYKTIYNLTKDKRKFIRGIPLSCEEQSNWNEGYTIINLMKSKTFDGLSGRISFDTEGFRTDFVVDILELTFGGLMKIANWNSTTRIVDIKRSINNQPDKADNMFNKTLIVIISTTPPYQMLKDTTTPLYGNDRYEGYGIDVIEQLSKLLGFNYTFVLQEDGQYGILNKSTGKWNGMMGEIIDGRADLAITDLTITSERESAVDFSEPFMNLGITILYKKPEPVPPSLFMFVSPFSTNVWIMLGLSYILVSTAIFIMGRLSPSEWQNPYPCVEEPQYLINQFSIRNSLWFTIGALMQQGSELAPISISTRAASGFWWFFILTMVSSYTANLAAFLTVTTLVTPFNDIDELAELAQKKQISFGAKSSGATANYFRDSNLTKYKEIWNYMLKHPDMMMGDNDAGVEKAEKENYAFLMESTSIDYVIERHCGLAKVGPLLDDKGYGIAMKKFSPYRNDISTAILQLQEKGILTNLKIKWWKEKRGGGKCMAKEENSEATPLDLQNVGGVFLVMFLGSILAAVGSLSELAWYIYKKAEKENISFKEEFKKELKFVVKFKQNVREIDTISNKTNSDKNLIGHIKY